MAELTQHDKDYLLEIVEDTSSDLDDGREGFPFYEISGDVLLVEFETADEVEAEREIMRGRWQLTYLGGEKFPKGEKS